jgi:hypothetical protein
MNKFSDTDVEKLAIIINKSSNWVQVAVSMGGSRGSGNRYKLLAIEKNINFSHIISHMNSVEYSDSIPRAFVPNLRADRLSQRKSAIGTAIRWFLANNYLPSVPIETARYDLVVESEQGFKKVQVKSTEFIKKNGKFSVSLHTTEYDPISHKFKASPYKKQDVDYFFIACSDGTNFLIPYEIVGSKTTLTVTDKYKNFAV